MSVNLASAFSVEVKAYDRKVLIKQKIEVLDAAKGLVDAE